MSKFKLISIITAIVAVCAVVLAIIFVPRLFSDKTGSSGSAANMTSEEITEKMNAGGQTEDQRHFKRFGFDDSAYTPGQFGKDLYGRPVWVPINPNGDPGLYKPKYFGAEIKGALLDPVDVQEQYVHGRYIAVSDESGPGNFENKIPTVYSKTLSGAVTAASNFMTAAYSFKDRYAIEYWKTFCKGDVCAEAIAKGAQTDGPTNVPAPGYKAFRVEKVDSKTGILVLDLAAYMPYDLKTGEKYEKMKYSVTRVIMQYDDSSRNWMFVLDKASNQMPSIQPVLDEIPQLEWLAIRYNDHDWQ